MKIKPKKPLDEQEDEDENDISINAIAIGDMTLHSKKPIKNPAKVVSSILRNKEIRSYLQIYDKQKIVGKPSYVD